MNLSDMRSSIAANGITSSVLESQVIPEQTVTIPATIQYPDYRRAYDSGTLVQGDTIVLTTQIFDSDGNEKSPDNNVVQLSLSQYTQDSTKEVLGVLYFDFVESNLPVSVDVPTGLGVDTQLGTASPKV